MRRHAKASTAGPNQSQALGRVLSLACLTATLLCLAVVPPAFGATVTDRPLLFSFDGSDTTAGHLLRPANIAVDNSTGSVYVAEANDSGGSFVNEAVSKFDADGNAVNFNAPGVSSLFGSPPFGNDAGLAVDNSGGPNQGRLYVSTGTYLGGTNRLIAYAPNGELLWQLDPNGNALDVAVDSEGHPWVLINAGIVKEYANTGSPPAQIGSFPYTGGPIGGTHASLDIDANDNFYIVTTSGVKKYSGGSFVSTLDPNTYTGDVYADQSSVTGHVFTAHGAGLDNFNEYDSSGTLVGTFGAGIAQIDASGGIAYNKSLDRVYVSDWGPDEIDVFGPAATGTVPDPSIEPATGIGIAKATLHGTINPQSVPNAYYFEWATSSGFEQSSRSPLQSLPEDSSPHAVSFEPDDLFGNSNHSARLIAVNTTTGLREVSGTTTFKTLKATATPVVTIDQPSLVTTTTAHITGTINPKEDSVNWGVETSTDTTCTTGFSGPVNKVLPGGGVNSPVSVEVDLKHLLTAQHYCVRIRAFNSFGETISATKEFNTEAVAPSEVSTAFAAPRTDTTARINARINPEGQADFTYGFELSEDGIDWTALPEHESTLDARRQIVVADELSGLAPNTTYHYRLAVVENSGGATAFSPEAKTFTTRTTAEMNPPTRGVELVNNPDKGNQNAFVPQKFRAITSDGEKALWTVPGGAPGGPNGTFSAFLAERTAGGWRSRSLAPPSALQVGGGGLAYLPEQATADFSKFSFLVEQPVVLGVQSRATRVSLDSHQGQEILRSYEWSTAQNQPGGVDMTEDGSRFLAINRASGQLEELGGVGEVVSLMPDETPSSCGLNTYEGASFVGGTRGGGSDAAALAWRDGYQMIDAVDASIVYFEAKPNGECGKPWGLYVRDRDAQETTLIDPGAAGKDVVFIRATRDGRSGYFGTFSNLDPTDTNESGDVYRWDLDAGESICLTCVLPEARVEIERGVMVSDDFSHVYFQSERRLVGDLGEAGATNVYALSDGDVRFVTTAGNSSPLFPGSGAQLSSDGSIFQFSAVAQPEITADDVGGCGSLCAEAYRYDDRDESVECLSCEHGGVTTHPVEGTGGFTLLTQFPLSADGSTTIFGTAERLTQLDVNGGEDIYEWRNGVRRLVTDGVTEFPTGFAGPIVRGVDADGSDVFFTVTASGLTDFEQDGLSNFYDARLGGGFEPPSPPVHCDGDSCQGPLVAPPAARGALSSAFSGMGNQRSSKPRRPCAKRRGKARRRCIRRHNRGSLKAGTNDNAGRTK